MRAFHLHLRRWAAILIGLVFLVSGILKLWDPVGTGLIVREYGRLVHLTIGLSFAKVLGFALAFTECAVGTGLITGVLRRFCAIAASIMLALFTIVTLLLWIMNPSMDCGCFGEAVHLSHAKSFLKNLVLLALAAAAFIPFREFGRPRPHSRVSAGLAMAVIILGAIWSNTHLPMVDFTEFNWGAQLFASLDENAGPEAFRNAPMLGFADENGEYCDYLAASGKVVVFSVYDLSSAPWETLEAQYRETEATGALPLLLVASYPGDEALNAIPAGIQPYFADYKTLITLNRSNGGGAYFYEGELVHKWASAHFPADIDAAVQDDPVALSSHYVARRRLVAQGFCVVLAAIFLLV